MTEAQQFLAYGLLKDAALQFARLSDSDLLVYARVYSTFAKTWVDSHEASLGLSTAQSVEQLKQAPSAAVQPREPRLSKS